MASEKTIQTICILRLSALGDVCNAVPAVRAIQRKWPNAEITWLIGPIEHRFLAGMDGVTFLPVDKRYPNRSRRALRRHLAGKQFDVLLNMQYAFRASLISFGVSAKRRVGFRGERAREFQWMFTNEKVADAPSPHVLDGFMSFAAHLGCEDLSVRWDLPISEEDREWVEHRLIESRPRRMLICPAGSKAYKDWTVEGYAAAAALAAKHGFDVFLATGPAPREIRLAEDIVKASKVAVFNLAGETSLKQLYALIDACDFVLAPDSGPGHMAASLGRPVVSLTAHHNPLRTSPYGYRQYCVTTWAEEIARQSGKNPEDLPWRTRLNDDEAMQRLPVDRVLKTMEEVIASLPRS